MRKTFMIGTLASSSFLVFAAPTFAQTADPGARYQPAGATTEEIIVTAQRRTERVTDVPISITVANQAQLERQQVNTVSDLDQVAASLEIRQSPGQNTGGGGSIRGIGTQNFNNAAGTVASVGIVVDQVSQGNANISDLFDISRIEVLKGPQGTLFGLTTSAGVINVTTNAPDPAGFNARLRTDLSNDGTAGSKYGNQVVQGLINIPLGTDAALRVSGVLNRRQGPGHNTGSAGDSEINRYGLRARLLWRPSSQLTFNLIGDYAHSTTKNGGDFFTYVKSSMSAELESCGVSPGVGNRNFCIDQGYTGRNKNYGASLQVDYEATPFTITSITAYRRNEDEGANAASNTLRADTLSYQIHNGDADRHLSLFTQELRVTSPASQLVEYTVGTFFSHQREVRDPTSLSVMIYPAPGVAIQSVNSIGAHDVIEDTSMAVFGQATIHLDPRFRLIAGGRFTAEKIALDRHNFDAPSASSEQHESLSTERFSYRLGAQYDVTPAMMIYATASRGYKAGSIATPQFGVAPYVVKPEIPTDYQVGLKATLLDGWVLDLSTFYDKIQNFQAQECTVNPATLAISCVPKNINDVKSRGAEINLFGRVFEGLSVNSGFILAKATYPQGYVGTDGTNIGGTQLTHAPKYKFTLSGEYEHPVTSRFNGFLALNAVWKSRVRYEANSVEGTTFEPHWIVGGRIGMRTADDRFSVAVFARNLFDKHEPVLMQSDLPNGGAANIGAVYGPQSFRQVGLSLDAKF